MLSIDLDTEQAGWEGGLTSPFPQTCLLSWEPVASSRDLAGAPWRLLPGLVYAYTVWCAGAGGLRDRSRRCLSAIAAHVLAVWFGDGLLISLTWHALGLAQTA